MARKLFIETEREMGVAEAVYLVAKHREEREQADRQGQIEQLKALLETLESGDYETAIEWVRAAIKVLEKK